MPLTGKGEKILGNMQEQYGAEKGKSVFYASKNKGTISGVDAVKIKAIADSAARLRARVDAGIFGFGKKSEKSENEELRELRTRNSSKSSFFPNSAKYRSNYAKAEKEAKEKLGIKTPKGKKSASHKGAKGSEQDRDKNGRFDAESRDDAYDFATGGSMELLSRLRTDAARADVDPFTISMAMIMGWSVYEIVQSIRLFRKMKEEGKKTKEQITLLEEAIEKLERAKREKEKGRKDALDKPEGMSQAEWDRLDDPEELAKSFEKLAVAARSRNPELAKAYLQMSKEIRSRASRKDTQIPSREKLEAMSVSELKALMKEHLPYRDRTQPKLALIMELDEGRNGGPGLQSRY
jgi:hypothetical protein